MKCLFWNLGRLVCAVLLVGCQSQKAAFMLPRTQLAPVAPPPTAQRQAPLLPPFALAPTPARKVHRLPKPATTAKPLPAPRLFQHSERKAATTAHRRPMPARVGHQPELNHQHETGHLVLGVGLVVGGVVLGVLLGGWLGLGVGALIVVLGYYFLGLAFGGQHAWQEVFQEFFNL